MKDPERRNDALHTRHAAMMDWFSLTKTQSVLSAVTVGGRERRILRDGEIIQRTPHSPRFNTRLSLIRTAMLYYTISLTRRLRACTCFLADKEASISDGELVPRSPHPPRFYGLLVLSAAD